MFHFWFISLGYGKVCDRIIPVGAKLGARIQVQIIDREWTDAQVTEQLCRLADQAEEQGVDGILCRGRAEQILKAKRRNGSIPVVPLEHLGSNTLSLLSSLKKTHPEEFQAPCPKVVLFSYKPIYFEPDTVRDLAGVRLENMVLERSDEGYVEEKLREALAQGMCFGIGGRQVEKIALRLGIRCYFVQDNVNYDAMYSAVKTAILLAENLKIQRERNQELKNLINYSFEAVLQLDLEGRVTFWNASANELLALEGQQGKGRYVWEVVPELNQEQARKVLDGRENIYGQVIRLPHCVAVINVIPYVKNGETGGAIVHLTQREQLEKMEEELRRALYHKGQVAKYTFSDILGQSEALAQCKSRAARFARHPANVLIIGETGTGKELFAQSIHNESLRKEQPFVAVNCGALPVNLLESELFGYVGGAFTGASRQGKKGLLEVADKGTIFLDEISEMDLQGQVRLLRFIEEREITRVGDDRVIPVDVRVIAATNKNLRRLVAEGKFREDLYYRLNVLTLQIPPLRERKEDIAFLAEAFLRRYGKRASKNVFLTPEAKEAMCRYPWQGNVRQLKNFCQRLVIISESREVDRAMVLEQLQEVYQEETDRLEGFLDPEDSGKETQAGEAEAIRQALEGCGWNRGKAAERLGMGRTSLWRKMRKYGIEEPTGRVFQANCSK